LVQGEREGKAGFCGSLRRDFRTRWARLALKNLSALKNLGDDFRPGDGEREREPIPLVAEATPRRRAADFARDAEMLLRDLRCRMEAAPRR